eukprot:TRINITY_DN15575_c0_g1_i1.p1 TRINITY_DN15575_c0_g1~~TRINITY_DN15575_c0_g1_i1.p1  ORF type:complete len:531 (-),score=136.09 TRINITY_DN15575_c0_g1_i1:122-1678(-)
MEASKFSENYPEILKSLKAIYAAKMLEVEQRFLFSEFHGSQLRKSDFEAKPMVMLLGQYSVGKTSFIEYLLKRKFPGERVGPEPTTDRFVAVMYGDEDQIVPGNALSVDEDQPFHGTNEFGSSFLSKFEASKCKADILKNITLIDTPGVLSGEKQRLGRAYDFIQVTEWFASRSDLILLLFDAHKLDISDEFKEAIEQLRGNDDKVRVVFNKCDMVNTQQLMRVYGALMWALGKVIRTPEVLRVYLGSFWDKPYAAQGKENEKLFEAETKDLLEDLLALPKNSAVRKINELVKRARLVRAHAYIISHLREKMPLMFRKESTKADLIENLGREFAEIERVYKIPPGDFPNLAKMQDLLKAHDFSDFPKASERLFQQIEDVMTKDLPKLMKLMAPAPTSAIAHNPFAQEPWIISAQMKETYDAVFFGLNPKNGYLDGAAARDPLMATGVAIDDLRKIWDLCDFERDGNLDSDSFALALFLSEAAKQGKKPPPVLPISFVPPSKRRKYAAAVQAKMQQQKH